MSRRPCRPRRSGLPLGERRAQCARVRERAKQRGGPRMARKGSPRGAKAKAGDRREPTTDAAGAAARGKQGIRSRARRARRKARMDAPARRRGAPTLGGQPAARPNATGNRERGGAASRRAEDKQKRGGRAARRNWRLRRPRKKSWRRLGRFLMRQDGAAHNESFG